MKFDDENYRAAGETFQGVAEELVRRPDADDPEGPRDSIGMRWMKFATIIIFLAAVFGFGFLCVDYLIQYRMAKHDIGQSAQATEQTVKQGMRNVFLMGAGVGGALGLTYVVRCIVRKVDP